MSYSPRAHTLQSAVQVSRLSRAHAPECPCASTACASPERAHRPITAPGPFPQCNACGTPCICENLSNAETRVDEEWVGRLGGHWQYDDGHASGYTDALLAARAVLKTKSEELTSETDRAICQQDLALIETLLANHFGNLSSDSN